MSSPIPPAPEPSAEAIVVRVAGGAGASRTDRRRAAIVEAATRLFLRHGYQGTSVDEIAAHAAASKQTVYKQFGDKEQLFRAIVEGLSASVEEFTAELTGTFDDLSDPVDVAVALEDFARRYIAFTVRTPVIAVRRLVIGEATRFPELARDYFQRVPRYFLGVVAGWFADLARRGLLAVDDPALAADQFGFLVVGQALDQATFCGADREPADLERVAVAGARVFLRAHRPARRGSDGAQMQSGDI